MMITIDETLERFASCGAEFRGGLANHGPMAADAPQPHFCSGQSGFMLQ